MLAHFDERGGFSKPVPELGEAALDKLLFHDLARVGARR
jgi:hypothetical protein